MSPKPASVPHRRIPCDDGSRRRSQIPDHTPTATVHAATAAFLARTDLAASSRRSCAQTLNRLAAELGDDSPLGCLDADRLSAAMLGAWGACAPATWNRHVATARSFVAVCQRRDWLSQILSLNVEDVDRDIRRALVRSKGGDIDLLHFQPDRPGSYRGCATRRSRIRPRTTSPCRC